MIYNVLQGGNNIISIRKTITSLIIFSLIMPCFLVSSVWASGGAVNDSAICDKGSTVLINVLANDTTELKYIGPISQPKHGTAIIENGVIRYTPDPNWSGIDTFTYSVPLNDENIYKFCIDTGHYYDFVSGIFTWDDANANASALSLYGLKGYLVTITSQEENVFIASMEDVNATENSAWMGATDDPSITGDTNNNWYWVTGPEAGTKFFYGRHPDIGPECYIYCNWNVEEPNDGSGGGESYGEFYYSGSWNDLPKDSNNIDGYIVEYGGMPNDVSTLPTATVTVHVQNNSQLAIHSQLKSSYNNRLKTVNILQTQILNKLPVDCKQSGVSSAGCSVSENVKSSWNEAQQYIENAKKTGNVIKAVNDLKKAKELLEQILRIL
ncbi:MAG: hypothetical protein KO464_02475 [Candidatus Methanofastidiosum sp.]|nr:hypothetical protein [Methanofastidiosum sp.]